MFPALVSALSIVICAFVLKNVQMGADLRVVVALIPVAPSAWLVWQMGRAILGLDELQRKIQLEGLALAFAATTLFTVIYGMLQVAKVGVPDLQLFYVYVVMILFYALGTYLAGRRYR
jgi:hypothetical protein